MMRRAFLAFFISSFFLHSAVAQQSDPLTSDKSIADSVASDFLRGIDTGDLSALYDRLAGPTLRASVQRTDFEQTAGFYRLQFGGPATSRALVGSQSLSTIPATGQQGSFYYVRYRVSFLNGFVYEDVFLEKEDGAWKVHSMQYFPAPAAAPMTR